jgi:hypothetical protein
MTLLLNLTAETERILKEKAVCAGQTLEGFLKEVVEREAAATNRAGQCPRPLAANQWSAEWRAWANADR